MEVKPGGRRAGRTTTRADAMTTFLRCHIRGQIQAAPD